MMESKTTLTPDTIVTEARRWIGTPWVPHASVVGIGADCIGIHKGLGIAFDLSTSPIPGEHIGILRAMDWYLHTSREYFREAFLLTGILEEVSITGMQPGDTILLGFGRNPASHAGIISTITPHERFIHTDFRREVVEAMLAPVKHRIRFVFRLRYEDMT